MLVRLLREHLRPYRRDLVLILLLQILTVLGMLFLPALNADIVDEGVVAGDTGRILELGLVMLAVTLAGAVGSIGATYYASRAAMAVGRDLRADLFAKVQSFSGREVGRFGTPSLITRVTNDVQQVQMVALLTFTMLVTAPIMGVGGIVMALRENVSLTLVLLLALPAMAAVFAVVLRRMRPLYGRMQEYLDVINRILREQITGVRVVRAFVKEDVERARFRRTNRRLRGVSTRVGFLIAMMFPLLMLIANLFSVGVLWFGARRVDAGEMGVGSLMAFLSYLMMILMAVMFAAFMVLTMPRAEVSAQRIREVLDTSSSVVPPVRPVRKLPVRGRVELRGVGFGYPGAEQPVLHDIDLVAEPGEVIAIVGSTGSGKTTLLDLIPRLFDATAGNVLVGGVDVRELDPSLLSRTVGYILQKPFLFSGTIASNLRYGHPDATDDELWQALEVAQAREFVEELPEKLSAPVSQGGGNFSGGQRQRLAIARTLVARPDVYLFDDSFSALDYATDAALRAALPEYTSGATILIVAQRVNTIRHADRIVVLDRGTVVGTGTHHELMAGNSTYREIVLSQLTESEAA
ncbi:ABC transporter ATP-binding protein [Actinocorallia populi]|uniref:ABC transporter ATP-binding protein n=1 Tax=Actinocorallia populi TaxID=2079200 RepID=UPI000D08F189|nr:ABC transporter ATP-binding protein [Actinocorallia populi]